MNKNNEIDLSKIQNLISEFNINSLSDLDTLLNRITKVTVEEMLNQELDNHLGYNKHSNSNNITTNRRNGKTVKNAKSKNGKMIIDVPRDREGTFEPQILPKRSSDLSTIEEKILMMYSKGMSQRDIAEMTSEIYGFAASKDMVNRIVDKVLPLVKEWRKRPLNKCYPFIFVDCIFVSIKTNNKVKKEPVYAVLGYTLTGQKELLGLWMAETESKSKWMNIFDEIKERGVEEILFISMDGVSGLEDGAKSIFPNAVVQRCMVHLVRNSTKYVPKKKMAEFCKDLKSIYSGINAEMAEDAYEELNEKWKEYPGALRVWNNNKESVLQLYNYPSAIRKIMYTTNAIEAVNSSFRKVTKKGSFQDEESVYKALYLRITQLENKWGTRKITNWEMVLNQMIIDEDLNEILEKYLD